MTIEQPRYALYFSPVPGGPWWTAWSSWLGRCAATGCVVTQPHVDGIAADAFATLTAEPRRYGWHATLRAPFRLHVDASFAMLETVVEEIAARHAPFACPRMSVTRLDDFLALVPVADSDVLKHVAADAVRETDRLRAPLTEQEFLRRRRVTLSARQEELLMRWGYPYVLDEFRFHFSLTGPLASQSARTIAMATRAAEAQLSALADDVQLFDALSLFVEPAPGADFKLLRRFPLRA